MMNDIYNADQIDQNF